MKILLQALLLTRLAAPAAAQCSLCPTNSTLGAPEFELMDLLESEDSTTCADYDALLAVLSDDESCVAAQTAMENDFGIDFPAICQCSDVEPPQTCSFCDSPASVTDDPDLALQCAYLNNISPFVSSEAFCAEISNYVPTCCTAFDACGICVNGGEPGRPNELIFDDFTCGDIDMDYATFPEGEFCDAARGDLGGVGAVCGCEGEVAACGLCKNGGKPGNPDRSLGEDTCGEYNNYLALFPEDDCDAVLAGIVAESGIAIGAFCGCEGEDIPDKCALCPEGEEVAHPDVPIPDSDLTCAEGEQVVRFVTDETICEFLLEDDFVQTVCGCVPKSVKKGGKKSSKKSSKKGSKKSGKKMMEKDGKKSKKGKK